MFLEKSPSEQSPAAKQLLAKYVKQELQVLGLEEPTVPHPSGMIGTSYQRSLIADKIREIFEICSIDPKDGDELSDTPDRVANLLVENILWGLDYDNFPEIKYLPESHVNHEQPNIVRGIQFTSCCRHHMLPFVGHAFIAYRSSKAAIGLSKFHRIVNFYARRLQTQEHLTKQIHAAVSVILQTEDVLVILRAQHMCVVARGMKDHSSDFTTTKSAGYFTDKLTDYMLYMRE